ncbi:MAG: family 1 glycosylhydrolase [Candidatus Omnitrophica bacterium]|nr:family 1 glycosylhydrolase [Candidatus Omnitrophota bacterium]
MRNFSSINKSAGSPAGLKALGDYNFPASFLWGAAISSYQTEGANYNSDWYLFEKERKLKEAGRAANHYELFPQDFKLAKELNLSAIRLSFEWARISPAPGIYSYDEINHYKEVIKTLKILGLKPFVTIHHFTNPIWMAQSNGFESSKNIDYFLGYLKKIVEEFKDDVSDWLIFNEPLVYVYNGYICGRWAPGIKNLWRAQKVLSNIKSAYMDGYKEIKNIYGTNNKDNRVSIVNHIRKFSPCPNFNLGQNSFSAFVKNKLSNFDIIDYLAKKSCLDYLALNYYCKEYVKFNGLVGDECAHKDHKERRNYLDWYIYPEGLYELLKEFKSYNLPVYIMENGTAEADDSLYREYLVSHIKCVARAASEGLDVKGYFWWSLIDNFEWDLGFGPKFGLIDINYETFERRIKPFAYTYAKICRENRIEA